MRGYLCAFHLNRPLEIKCLRLQTFYSAQENGKSFLENCVRNKAVSLLEGYHHVGVINEFTNCLFFATVRFSRAFKQTFGNQLSKVVNLLLYIGEW